MHVPAVQLIPRRPTPLRPRAVKPASVAFGIAVVALITLRACWLVHARLDSDEPQHLHVVANWARGQVAYRDFFDNHAPLFHLLMTPLVRLTGSSPAIVWTARIAMLPLWGAMLVFTYRIARRLFDPARAAWATLALAAWPVFFRSSLEFRTDNLWAAFWLAAIDVLICAPLTRARVFSVGLLLGLDLITSPKTLLLILALLVSSAVAARTHPNVLGNWRKRNRIWVYVKVCSAGLAIPPAILLTGLAFLHAARPFADCVLFHHVNRELLGGAHAVWRPALAIPLTLLVAWLAGRVHDHPQTPTGFYRALVFCLGLLCFIGFDTVWPLADWQDHLPFEPLVAASLVPLLIGVGERSRRWVAPALIGVELLSLLLATPLQDQTLGPRRRLAKVLRLTSQDECVLDLKGETIFRPRPWPAVFETVTRRQFAARPELDDLPERLTRTRTHVVICDHPWFPPRGRAFMNRFYIPVNDADEPNPFSPDAGPVRVSGQWLGRLDPGVPCTFQIAVPGRYALVCPGGEPHGMLDGSPYVSPRELSAGVHHFVSADRKSACAVVWARAAERGFGPFGKLIPKVAQSLPR